VGLRVAGEALAPRFIATNLHKKQHCGAVIAQLFKIGGCGGYLNAKMVQGAQNPLALRAPASFLTGAIFHHFQQKPFQPPVFCQHFGKASLRLFYRLRQISAHPLEVLGDALGCLG
jgi:hypothetical protein